MNYLIKLSKRSYYNIFFSIQVKNGKRIWQGIKQIVQINPQVNQLISKIVSENCEITDPKAIANAFNNYFANKGANLASSIPSASKTGNEFMPPPICDSLFLCKVTADERISTWASPFLNYINDFHNCSELLDFHLFADDANLSSKHKDINILESEINSELANLHIWLSANKLSLNIEKSNFVIFSHAVVNFTCSFEVKAHAIHKNRAQTKSQQQRIELVSQINQSYIFINDLQKTLDQR